MAQSVSGIGQFPFANQPQIIQLPQGQFVVAQPQLFGGQQLNPLQLAHLQTLQQTGQLNGQNMGMQGGQGAPQQVSAQQQQQQQRKTLFTPYLPQANLPALLADGQLVTGILRVNKKNRSDAYVTTADLDADIFICGSKDRNRALEGDLVAVELLDVDEVWNQKREKEEKKKRKDITDTRSGSTAGLDRSSRSDAGTNGGAPEVGPDGSIRRRGSLRQRPTQKKNDDVEVEGQSLLLVEEEEISDEAKPLYAGHVVAVIERVPGQMFSGSLGLLRPSSQATKEKQEAERQARDGSHQRQHHDRQQDNKPKIVWFKPTDKRVPLIAIPTEQAPRDFVENHQSYSNNIFVASIKRWPITSLHPFGTLVENLGPMGDLKVETDALLRDNNFGADDFSDPVMRNVGYEDWSIANEDATEISARRDFREETTFTIDPNGTEALDDAIHMKVIDNGKVEIGIHVADVSHFIKTNSLVDREARKRGSAVYLTNRVVPMLPARLSNEVCSLLPGKDRLTVSVVFLVDRKSGAVEGEPFIGKGIIRSSGKLSYGDIEAVIAGNKDVELQGTTVEDIKTLNVSCITRFCLLLVRYGTNCRSSLVKDIATRFREARFGNRSENMPSLRLLGLLDDESIPVERNIFDSSPAHEFMEELSHKANSFVAKLLFTTLPEKAFLRHQAPPNSRRLKTFVERMTRLGYDLDPSSSGSLQNSLVQIEDLDIRKVLEAHSFFIFLSCHANQTFVGHGNTPSQVVAPRQILHSLVRERG
jgi:protein SSD1